MGDKRSTPRRVQPRGAYKALVKPEPIVADKAQQEWEKGCKWAAFAMAAVWGPLIAVGIMLGWV